MQAVMKSRQLKKSTSSYKRGDNYNKIQAVMKRVDKYNKLQAAIKRVDNYNKIGRYLV